MLRFGEESIVNIDQIVKQAEPANTKKSKASIWRQSIVNIDQIVKQAEPANTKKSKASIWRQFCEFCDAKNYSIEQNVREEELADILKDWAFNVRKVNGEEYKEGVVKTMWNVTAKLLQEKFNNEYRETRGRTGYRGGMKCDVIRRQGGAASAWK
ncbi:hypothetical protein QE152_g9378 [Popillia japonica]|uniref:Uncharacterized protein n=1 Tax=Popillia japonica TaxID=7064 RepID=A0AAW1LV00_POPJA